MSEHVFDYGIEETMKNAILVHGWVSKQEYYDEKYPTASNFHWFPWLTKQLMIRDIHTVAVEMPNGFYPQYAVWKREFERFDITSETVLVGHSCGGGFLVRWLSETDQKVGRVVLVAPWIGYNVKSIDYLAKGEEFDHTFFEFSLDADLVKKTDGVTIIASRDDKGGVQESVAELREKLHDVDYIEFADKGHFTLRSLGGEAFPELLEVIVNER